MQSVFYIERKNANRAQMIPMELLWVDVALTTS